MKVSTDTLQKNRGYANGQAMFSNEALKNIRFLSTSEEVSISGANCCNRIADEIIKKGGVVPSFKSGYVYLQAIVEAIDWAFANPGVFEKTPWGGLYLVTGHSGDSAQLDLVRCQILYVRKGQGCWIAATFEKK